MPNRPSQGKPTRISQQTVHVPETALTLTRLGPRALRAEVADVAQAISLAAFARRARVPAEEIVPGARTVVLEGVADLSAAASVLSGWSPEVDAVEPGPLVDVPVTYDGADLDDVAARWGTDPAGVVRRMGETELVSAFCGFAPGFAYLSGLPAYLAVPRLDVPRTRVPVGSVAVADRWCGIYPTASPGGWRLLGHTSVSLWDASRVDAPALLAPGTRVRLVPA